MKYILAIAALVAACVTTISARAYDDVETVVEYEIIPDSLISVNDTAAINIPRIVGDYVSGQFVTAPAAIFPLLDSLTRLDMLDYYRYGVDYPSTNRMGGDSRIIDAAPGSMRVAMTTASNYQLAALPCGGDTATLLIANYSLPAVDSKVAVYSSDWTDMTKSCFVMPELDKLLTPAGKKNVDEIVRNLSFLVLQCDFDPQSLLLTVKNNSLEPLSREQQEKLAPWLKPQLAYRWNGKKFVEVK